MSFRDKMQQFSQEALERKKSCKTEEAVKTSLVLPFIQLLGYNIFNPEEVVPEYTCDVGIKKGEKVDYAICYDGEPILLIECKCGEEINSCHINQLYRYYTATNARIAILTNGVEYMFFADTSRPNIMDTRPFYSFNITKLTDLEISYLIKFQRKYFNASYICDTILGIRYITESIRAHEQEKNEICQHKNEKIELLKNHISELQNVVQILSNERNDYYNELKQLKEEIIANVEAKRQEEVNNVNNKQANLIEYLNMPVPINWSIMTDSERREYWEDKSSWAGAPRTYVCTTEVAKEFFSDEYNGMQSMRECAKAIRMTGLFIQTGYKKRFGKYGVQLAWIRKTRLSTQKK